MSGDYLNGIQTIINNDLQTQREIAALVYGVDVEDARQIPLKKYIEGCINGEEDHDINQYAETNKQFDTVLEEVIQCMDNALIDKIIHCLHKLTRKSDVSNYSAIAIRHLPSYNDRMVLMALSCD